MTWNHRTADSAWIHLGYLASMATSVLAPMARGSKLVPSESDREALRSLRDFFGSAIAGLASFDRPDLLFSSREEEVLLVPAGSLEIAAAVYSDLQGAPIADAPGFRAELSRHRDVLKNVAAGKTVPILHVRGVLRFLDALIVRAKTAMYGSLAMPK